MVTWDFIVVGAGSAGCALAARLAEKSLGRVLVLEAGPPDRSILFKAPAGVGLYGIGRYDWGYQSEPDPSRQGRVENWPRGRVLGGSSSINGMIYVRGSRTDFDRWTTDLGPAWSADQIMSHYEELERCDPGSFPGAPAGRGFAGQLHVRRVKSPHPVTVAFLESARRTGLAINPDYNGQHQEGVSYLQLTQRHGRRCSSADAFLRPALRSGNIDLVGRAQVHRLVVNGRTVAGVVYEREGQISEARAHRTILCAGTINTPKILMLSGIGPATDLTRLGIRIVADLLAVGRNLVEHPLFRMVYRVNVPTYNLTGGFRQKLAFLGKYLAHRQGPLASCMEAVAFVKSAPGETEPDIQLHMAPLGFEGRKLLDTPLVSMLPFPSMTVLVNKNHPVSTGRIRLAGPDPSQPPLIEPRLLDRSQDIDTLARGMALVRRIVSNAPLSGYLVAEVIPGNAVLSEVAVADYLRAHVEAAYHPAGTCRMGYGPDAVVDPDMHVRGVEGLCVADASILPGLISGNTNAISMLIGDKLGRQLSARASISA